MCAIYIVVFLNKSLDNAFISPYLRALNFYLITYLKHSPMKIVFFPFRSVPFRSVP